MRNAGKTETPQMPSLKYLKSKEHEQPRIFSVSNISEFVEVATFFDDGVVFRGQTTCWPLVPTGGTESESEPVSSLREENVR